MARNSTSSAISASSTSDPMNAAGSPVVPVNSDTAFDIQKFRLTKDAQELSAWVKHEYTKARAARSSKQQQWVLNLSFFYGRQWLEATSKLLPGGYDNKLFVPRKPNYARRLTVNKTRSFVRREISKFISQSPDALVVPATGEDQDVAAAYAGEQVWDSLASSKQYEQKLARAIWWMVLSGNGFVKTQWDNSMTDPLNPAQQGNICFGPVTPFHLFVPDLREEEIEDQPYIIHAYTKPVGWIRQYFAHELEGISIQPSTTSANDIVQAGYLNITTSQEPDSCVVYECWVKPGGHKLLPNGGVIIQVDDTLVSVMPDGMPYAHGQYPFAHFKHIPSGTFYADSPLVDTNQLQKEYNQIRSEISEAGRRMARPQLIAMEGSIDPSKMTNEPGSIITYRPGTAAPQPIPLSPLPQYYVEQQETIQADWEDITGQHDASTGNVPAGLTAGTAINYLQEQDNQFLTPQYKSVEYATEKIAKQALTLFSQYVDIPRKIQTVGADEAFNTIMLTGADLKNGLDIRIEPGTSVAKSQAAKSAQVMQWFTVGLIQQDVALELLEIGGPQRVIDYVSAAKRKAQRENIKMKMLTPEAIQQAAMMSQAQGMIAPPQPNQNGQMVGDGQDPSAIVQAGMLTPGQAPQTPVVPVDDFDEHAVHVQSHTAFMMSQEYEMLPFEVKQEFVKHRNLHIQAMNQVSLQNFLQAMPTDGSQGAPPQSNDVPTPQAQAGATLSANGAAPQTAPDETGAS